MSVRIARRVHEKLKHGERGRQRAAVLMVAAATDYRDYEGEFRGDMSARERRRVLDTARRLEERAEKLGGRSVKWLRDTGFDTLFTEQEQDDIANFHPTELEEWAKKEPELWG